MKQLLIGAAFAAFATGAMAGTFPELSFDDLEELCGEITTIAEDAMVQRNLGTPQWLYALGMNAALAEAEAGNDGMPEEAIPYWRQVRNYTAEIVGDAWASDETTQAFMERTSGECLIRMTEILGEFIVE